MTDDQLFALADGLNERADALEAKWKGAKRLKVGEQHQRTKDVAFADGLRSAAELVRTTTITHARLAAGATTPPIQHALPPEIAERLGTYGVNVEYAAAPPSDSPIGMVLRASSIVTVKAVRDEETVPATRPL